MIKHSDVTIGFAEILAAVWAIITKNLITGHIVKKFEYKFRRFHYMPFAIAVNSGTSALHLALLGLGVKPGDEVIVPNYICASVINAVEYTGATPVICDCDCLDYSLNGFHFMDLISSKTKAIILPHMFGQCSSWIKNFLKMGIPIIEDCAQSIGAKHNGKLVGTFADVSIFSFHATKMLCTGSGGMILTRNSVLYNRIKDLRECDKKFIHETRYNYKMSDLSASMGIAQLNKLNKFIDKRKKLATLYTKLLWVNPNLEVSLPAKLNDHVYYRYIIKTPYKANLIISKLHKYGIEAAKPIHRPFLYGIYPVSDNAQDYNVSLPIYPNLSYRKVKYICKTLLKILKELDTCTF